MLCTTTEKIRQRAVTDEYRVRTHRPSVPKISKITHLSAHP